VEPQQRLAVAGDLHVKIDVVDPDVHRLAAVP
jgi:hypothetical protein